MDVDTVLRVGSYCETLLADPTFQFLCMYFEQNAVGEMLSTQDHETKKRESIYSRIKANREFLLMMKAFIEDKNKSLEPIETDQIDDPSVHNIYKD